MWLPVIISSTKLINRTSGGISHNATTLFRSPSFRMTRVMTHSLRPSKVVSLSGCRVHAEHGGSELWSTRRGNNYTCLTKHCGTYVKCLPNRSLFLICPLDSVLRDKQFSSFCTSHPLLAWLVWAIVSLAFLYVYQYCLRHSFSVSAYLEVRRDARALPVGSRN